jgi:hypothetical protein
LYASEKIDGWRWICDVGEVERCSAAGGLFERKWCVSRGSRISRAWHPADLRRVGCESALQFTTTTTTTSVKVANQEHSLVHNSNVDIKSNFAFENKSIESQRLETFTRRRNTEPFI